jgi:23S rRNA (cytidine1920-2'-O)/16S rRNA (cytidine1409-2'-O)-methyltransferase
MADAKRERLDVVLVRRGFAESRASARASIDAGLVQVNGQPALKPAELTAPDAAITFERAHPWASRGGLKLDHGLTVFGVDPTGRACLDIGASTGGFTDVLLARGARRVTSVDVGSGQMIARLRNDVRVQVIEGADARKLTPDMVGEPPGLVVCDASYIGLAKVLPVPLSLAAPGAELVALFKPQFEVGPAHVGRGGIVSDDAAIVRAADAVAQAFAELGWPVVGWSDSPIRGGDGNRESLLHARRLAR